MRQVTGSFKVIREGGAQSSGQADVVGCQAQRHVASTDSQSINFSAYSDPFSSSRSLEDRAMDAFFYGNPRQSLLLIMVDPNVISPPPNHRSTLEPEPKEEYDYRLSFENITSDEDMSDSEAATVDVEKPLIKTITFSMFQPLSEAAAAPQIPASTSREQVSIEEKSEVYSNDSVSDEGEVSMAAEDSDLLISSDSSLESQPQQLTPEILIASVSEKSTSSASVASDSGIFQCLECHKTFANKGSYTGHMKNVHGTQRFQCPLCQHIYGAKKYFREHLKRVHQGIKADPIEIDN